MKELTEQLHRFRTRNFNGIILIRTDGTIVMANKNSHRIFGYDENSLPGKNIEDIFGADIFRMIEYQFRRDPATGNFPGESLNLPGLKEDNSLIDCQILANPLPPDIPDLILLQIADLSEIHAFEKKIFEKNHLFVRMANNLPNVLYKIQIEPEYKFIYLSDGIKKITGYDPDAFFGKYAVQWENLIYKRDLERVIESKKAQLSMLNQYDINYKLVRKDGEICWIKDQGSGIYDKKNKLISIQGNILDITRMKSTQYSNYANILEFEDALKSKIASSINDHLQQKLAMAALSLKELENNLSGLPEKAIKSFSTGMALLDQSIRESRRISYDLIPRSIRDFGLTAAIDDLISLWQEELNTEIEFRNNADDLRLNNFQENSLFILLREILGIIKNKKITGPVIINFEHLTGFFIFSVGVSQNQEASTTSTWDKNALQIIKSRVQAFHGEFNHRVQKNNYIEFRIKAPINYNGNEKN